jgi:hypothetical protein
MQTTVGSTPTTDIELQFMFNITRSLTDSEISSVVGLNRLVGCIEL